MATKQVLFRSEAREKVLRGSATAPAPRRTGAGHRGFDAARKEYVDMVEAGTEVPEAKEEKVPALE